MVTATLAVLGALAVAVAYATPAPAAQFFGRRTIARFAPVLVLHPQERDLPTSGKGFLSNANLGFSHAGACGRDAAIHSRPWSSEAIARLGSGGFWERLTGPPPRCRGVGDGFTTTDYTRPYDDGRPAALRPSEGFYLDLADTAAARHGFPDRERGDNRYESGAPVYYDDGALFKGGKVSGAFITYWFFYAFNDGPRFRCCVHLPSGIDHEGDWENMSFRFRFNPTDGLYHLEDVSYSAHGAPKSLSAASAPRIATASGTRFVGFVAKGSHATYPAGGRHPIRHHGSTLADDIAAGSPRTGRVWQTWRHLRYLFSQGWSGYCGAWGEVGTAVEPRFRNHTTGPLGPGCLIGREPKKSGRPPGWGESFVSDDPQGSGQAVGWLRTNRP